MNDENKSFIYGAIVGVLVGFLLSCTMQGRNYNDTDRTLSTVKEQQRSIGAEIRNADNGITNAQNTVKRASVTISGVQERIIQSERIAIDNTDRVSNIEKIARECRSIAEENRIIFDNVGKTDSNAKTKQ